MIDALPGGGGAEGLATPALVGGVCGGGGAGTENRACFSRSLTAQRRSQDARTPN